MNIKTCTVRMHWPQEVSDELIRVFGEETDPYNVYFRILPEFGIHIKTGDLFAFWDINRDESRENHRYIEDYRYIEDMDDRTIDFLNYLERQNYTIYFVREGRLFDGNVLYIYFEMNLKNTILEFDDSIRASAIQERASKEGRLKEIQKYRRDNQIEGFDDMIDF